MSCFYVDALDGWRLEVAELSPPEPARSLGVVLLGHAMMVDRRSLDRPAGAGLGSHLASLGWHVLLPDLRGRGGSGPAAAEGGSWGYDDIVQHDLPALVAAARDRHPGLPLWVMGHSLTGHCSVAAAGCGFYAQQPDGHVLLSANMWTPSLEPKRLLRLRKGLAVAFFGLASRWTGYFPSRRLRIGPVDEAGAYVNDLGRFWRSDRWGSADGAHDYLEGLSRVTGPVLSVLGRDDRLLAAPSGAIAWASRLDPARSEVVVVGHGDWGLHFDPDHMTLATDPRSRPAWDTISAWMQKRAARSLPS